MVRDAIADEAARDLLVTAPAFFLVRAAKDAGSDGTRTLLREARRLVAAYNRSRSADAFLMLLDFAYLAVHNGDLDSRDNVGLRALYDWTREAVAFPALRALDHLRPRRRPAQAHGLRPRGSAPHQAPRPHGRAGRAWAETPGSS